MTAGFSASTLSDAAGGMRQPTLEVTLAYVGACGGDVAAWEERWNELNAVLNASPRPPAAPEPASEAEAAAASAAAVETAAVVFPDPAPGPDPASVDGHHDDHPDDRSVDLDTLESGADPADEPQVRRRRRPSVGMLVAAGAAVIALFASLVASQAGNEKTTAAPVSNTVSASKAPDCGVDATISPADDAKTKFTGMTYGAGAHIRAGATTNSPTLRTVPPGCQLHFSGYCLGDVVFDAFGGSPDMRWFELSSGGVVASAIVHNNPPGSVTASHCPDDAPPPASIALTLGTAPNATDTVQVSATGSHLGLVGFAAKFADVPNGPPSWHHLDLVTLQNGQFAYNWRITPVRNAQPTAQIPVVAVACLGGGGPTGVLDSHLLPPDQPATDPSAPPASAVPNTLTPQETPYASEAACKYPGPTSPKT
ncbi:hypothetical protein [Streptomyces tateyamensis]|uniref:hypothetical protein n=1 Tax=Streptomyces tateyamensis TaxID=565073 RepID=UPI000DA1D695|nr:hypothetical protein [Streptomyces tateyamensis]